ncbi:MAG TPA: ThuA domain-containing protein [Chryseosolibacter sp.]|nr:ThuA domain-containing protein [Chryseosolibacter sp.]
MIRLRYLILLLLFVFFIDGASGQSTKKVSWKKVKVLVYTRNGKGYVHKNIPNAVQAIQKLGTEKGFHVDVSEDPSVFTEANLKQYTFLLFPSTNNDVFDNDEQRLAFRRYIEAGGGFLGLHSVIGTERNWKWFKMMLGGSFAWHPKFQPFEIKLIDKAHPSVAGMPSTWKKEDECYFMKEMYPGIHVVMAHDLNSLKANEEDMEKIKSLSAQFADYYPAAWYQHFDGGTIWITTLGHHEKDYVDPMYLHHILQGMTFVASNVGKLDFSKSYATGRDTPLP